MYYETTLAPVDLGCDWSMAGDQRVRLDMHYIRNWSIWLDVQLLIQTLPAVIKKRGAY